MTKFCPQCGASLNEAQRFCNKCGASLQPTTPYAAPASEASTAHQTYAPPPPASAPYGNVSASYQSAPPVQPYQTGQLPQPPNYGQNSFNLGLTTNQICSLLYLLPILGPILGLVIEPYNRDREIRFHAWQSLLLTGAWFVLTRIAIPILKFTFIPDAFVWLMNTGAWFAFFGVWIYLIVQTWQGIKFRLPILGDVAEQQAQNQVKL
ncbi:MAG: zinc-ribbon domain-containing protein [Acidobacteria bacterium]|nr:zinc-ribbon domain-containing protein [Acidobacteriota bacterium]